MSELPVIPVRVCIFARGLATVAGSLTQGVNKGAFLVLLGKAVLAWPDL